jgi:UDP-3-O-[3-hydroxymyristoyl] N-acetylglucosamine deacetylase
MIKQKTLNVTTKAIGITVHQGNTAEIILKPAPINTGIVFRRVDLPKPMEIAANVNYVGDTTLCTSLIKEGVKIATVEHLLSAFAGMGIDNAYVDINSPEIPIMDGSACPFVFLIQSAGIKEQNAPKKFIRIKQKITVEEGDKWASLEPFKGFKVDFTIDFKHPAFSKTTNRAVFDFSVASYMKDISRARTFGFLADFERMRSMNLAKGASLSNAIALDNFRVLNEDGLRYPDEFVRHKILDAIGDLYLLGSNLMGAFKGYKSGHALNNKLLNALLSHQEAWEYITFEQVDAEVPLAFVEWEQVGA